MEDPYAQFSTPVNAQDPYASFSSVAKKPEAKSEHGGLRDFTKALGHNALYSTAGVGQTLIHGANALSGGHLGGLADYVDQGMQQGNEQYQKDVPDNAASYAGAVAGTVLPIIVGGAGKALDEGGAYLASKIPAASKSLMLSRMLSGGAQGAALSAAAPVTEKGDYADNKAHQIELGAALGGGAPLLAKGLGAVGRIAKNSIEPFTSPDTAALRHLSKVLPDSAFAEAPYASPVSGVKPTLAQSYGGQELVQAEKAARNTPSGAAAFNTLKEQNDSARLAAVQRLAGAEEDLQAAIAQRTAVTTPMRDALLTNGKPVDVTNIIGQVKKLINSPVGQNPQVASGARDILKQIRDNSESSNVTPHSYATHRMLIKPSVLDSIRQNANEYLSKYEPNGIVGTKQQAAIVPIKNSITDAIESANPGYRDYLATFAKLSQPINTMEAARGVLANVERNPLGADRTPILNLSQVRAQIKKAVKGSDYELHPDALKTLQGVEKDLQNETISNSQRLPGSDTAYNINAGGVFGMPSLALRVAGGALGGTAGFVGGPLGAVAGAGTGAILPELGSVAKKNVEKAYAKMLMNPETADLVKALRNKPPEAVPEYLQRLPLASALIGRQASN